MPDDDLTFYTRRAYQEGQAAASAANAELREALCMSADEDTSPAEWARHVVRLLDGTTARADAAESAVRKLRARAADVLGEPPDTSDAGGLSQVERAIQVGEAAAFRGTLISEWSIKAERVRQSFMSLADAVGENDVPDATDLDAALAAVASDIRALAAEIPSESEATTAARLREAANAEAARQVARCAAELGYVGEPATLAVAVGDACLAFARELREIHARHAVTVKRLEAEVDALKLAQVARDAEVKS